MFNTRAKNDRLNRLLVKGSVALLNDPNGMLLKSNDTAIYIKNIQKLMIEFYKYLYGL